MALDWEVWQLLWVLFLTELVVPSDPESIAFITDECMTMQQ